MNTFDRLSALKGRGRVEIRTRGGSFRGHVVALNTTDVELHKYHDYRCEDVEEIAYIPIEEICMIIHRLMPGW